MADSNQERARVSTSLQRLTPEHVKAMDSSERHALTVEDPDADLVSLDFGDGHSRVTMMGTLAELRALVTAADTALTQVAVARQRADDIEAEVPAP